MSLDARRLVLGTSLGQGAAALVTVPLSLVVSAFAASHEGANAAALAMLMIAVGAIEGAITGAAQTIALSNRAKRSAFVARSAVGFAIAWTFGVLATYVEPASDDRALVLVFAGVLGCVLGAAVGALESRLFFAPGARVGFVATSMAAWSVALVLASILADVIHVDGALAEVLVGAVRGLVVGACAGGILASAV